METKDLTNQTPEQANIPETEENAELSAVSSSAEETINESENPDDQPLMETSSEMLSVTEAPAHTSGDALPDVQNLTDETGSEEEQLTEVPETGEQAVLESHQPEPEMIEREAENAILVAEEPIAESGLTMIDNTVEKQDEEEAGIEQGEVAQDLDTEEEIPSEMEEELPEAPSELHLHEETEDYEDEDEEAEEESEEIYQNLTREQLVELMEATVQEPDIQSVKVKVALIKVAYLMKEKEEQQAQYDSYLKQGGTPEGYTPALDQLSERFQMAFNVYREKKQQYNEELEKEKLANLEAKKKILEELKTLISSEETLKRTYDEFKALQDKWKQIGMVPKSEVNQLWQNYHFLVEKFFDKVKINKELKDLDLRKNLERKIELCEKAEELLIETSIIKSFKQLQQYHEEWKEVGPVPQDKKDEIWERFKTASDQINERRREYYSKKQGELESNFLAKSALCEKAEKLVAHNPETLKQWQNRTTEVNDLLRVWKTIGPAPKKVNNEIWNRFKTCLDSHFTSYKEFLDKLKDQQLNNYNLKLDLCAQAEALKNSTDWRNTTQELIQLQKEWKAIGPVPRKHSDKIWKRFRAACDEFFKRKSEFFSNVAQVEDENMKKKEELIQRLQDFKFTDNRSENLEILKNFQREWLEIGHVPIREKDRLQNAFRAVINKHFDKLKINASEVSALNYKNRLESIKDSPDGNRMIYRERNSLQLKISKMQEDIMVWENNIGFLAESKNANILKVEFQKKIDQAKQELALMEAKLRYLKEI